MIGVAAAVGISAGLSWLLFGLLLLIVGRGGISLLSWMDGCLTTMSWGVGVKMVGVVVNLSGLGGADRGLWIVQSMLLVVADIVMGFVFVEQGRLRGVRRVAAISLWIFGLNVFMAILLPVVMRLSGAWRFV